MKKLLIVTALVLFAGIAFGQTLTKGSVIAVHNYSITLLPDVTMNQFVEFWTNKMIPEFDKVWPGGNQLVMIGDRGKHKYGFATISYFESVEQRDKLYPAEGDPNDAAIPEELVPIFEELGKYILSYEDDYTDYVIQ
jgi:hypothetical protein